MSLELREHFNYPTNLAYLNSGSMSLTPKSVLAAVAQAKNEYELNPTEGLFTAWEKMWKVQTDLAQFFNADPRNLFLRANVTIAMNDFIMALQLPPQSEILVSDIEYGTIVKICEHKAAIENHQLKTFSVYDHGQEPSTVTENQILSRLEAALTKKTKLVMLSHVMTGSGLTLPIEKIGKLLHDKGIFFACDGAHGAGAIPLDFSNTNVDFYGSNIHKWLMGPKGTGFAHVLPRVREYLVPKFAGWTTGTVLPHFAVFGNNDSWTQRWMICSTHNFSDFYGIRETLNFWNKIGSNKILTERKKLGEVCQSLFSKIPDWRCLSNFEPQLKSPLLAFSLPKKLSSLEFKLTFDLQQTHKIVMVSPVIQGEWVLRISPNIYNTEDELHRAFEVLKKLS